VAQKFRRRALWTAHLGRDSGVQNPVFWIATSIVVSSAMGSLACVVLFLAKLRIPTGGPVAGIALILPYRFLEPFSRVRARKRL